MAKKQKPSEEAKAAAAVPAVPPRLRERYFQQVLPELATKFNRTNRHALPRLEKIVINMGVGTAISEKKHLEDAVAALTLIAGQKAAITRSRKSIANFKLREGQEIGCKATLRGARIAADGSKTRFCKKCNADIGRLSPAKASRAKSAKPVAAGGKK